MPALPRATEQRQLRQRPLPRQEQARHWRRWRQQPLGLLQKRVSLALLRFPLLQKLWTVNR